MTISKRLRLALSLAPLLCAFALAIPAHAAPPGGGQPHVQSGVHGDFHRDFHDHGRHDHSRFGFGFGFGDPWWGPDYWDYAYWDYPYPYYYPYYYPPSPAYSGNPSAVPAPGQEPAQANGAPPPQFWYYCDNPQGYYPYVQNCSTTWKQVAATPPSGPSSTISPKPKP
jgi:hypothetical protein